MPAAPLRDSGRGGFGASCWVGLGAASSSPAEGGRAPGGCEETGGWGEMTELRLSVAFCWLRSGAGWLDAEAGREGIGSLLTRDAQLLELTASSSPRTFGGWSGSDYFSVAD